MVHVPLNWHRFDWYPDETWKKVTLPKLEYLGIKSSDLRRSVYVLRLNGNFCIQYPRGQSPTIYIGEGNLKQRICEHRAWVVELEELVGEFSFQVCIAMPRVKNNHDAYLDCEAALIDRFSFHYSSAPMWNKQYERRRFPYTYSHRQMDQSLCKRSGAKYKWAVAPMKSSGFYDNFVRTHFDT
jgi:hypothetical protein